MKKPDLAIFDLDNTILNGDSDYSMINYLIDMNILDEKAKDKNDKFISDYQNGILDFGSYTQFALAAYIGKSIDEINQIIFPFVEKIVESMINVFALKLLHQHFDNSDNILLASATNELIVKPIAKRLAIKNVVATKVKFVNKKCSGDFIPPFALGKGKLDLVRIWMKENNYYDFSGVTFYSDSINDLPLLELVEFPKVVNPDEQLKTIATERRWEIIFLPTI